MAYVKKKDGVFRDMATGRMYEHRGYARKIFWNRQMLDDLRRLFPTTLNEELAACLGVSPRTMIRKARELGLQKDPIWLAKVWEQRRQWAHMESRRKGYPGGFKPGVRNNPETEFKTGHTLTYEQQEKRREKMRRWYLEHPKKASEKARKAWETRRRKQAIEITENNLQNEREGS